MYCGEDYQKSDTQESEPYSMDFLDDLSNGETIASATCELSVVSGTDADVLTRLSGSPSIDGTIVTQRLVTLKTKTKYCVRFLAVTNQNNTLSLHSFVECGSV